MTAIKFTAKNVVFNGTRIRVTYAAGPWVNTVDPTTIKVRPKCKSFFPKELRETVQVENGSDVQIDYFEKDCIRVVAGHPLYAAIKTAAEA